jgi:hypothetical protein
MNEFEFLSVEFEFEGTHYNSLVRKKKLNNSFEYHVTIMDGELEKMLYGNHIIRQVNGTLLDECDSADKKVVDLKRTVTKALQKHIAAQESAAMAAARN